MGKQGSLRHERRFNEYKQDTYAFDVTQLIAVDQQAYLDMVRAGLDPWNYTYQVKDKVLRAYGDRTCKEALYDYDPSKATWTSSCVKDVPKAV